MKKQINSAGIKLVIAFYILFFSMQLQAQVCNSGKGSFAAHISFDTNPGDSLPSGKTSYTYTSSACPTEGYYTIVDNVQGCFGNSWYVIPVIPANGKMMLINASVNTGIVYTDTIQNLCANTNYVFGATIINVSLPSSCSGHPIRPRISFTVETLSGIILGNYTGGDLVEVQPTEYSVYFRTPPATGTIIIRITNNAPGGCGNDFTLDNIAVWPCGPVVDAHIKDVLGTSLDVCAGDPSFITLLATVGNGYNAPSYQWQIYNVTDWIDIPGATSLTYLRNPTGGTGTYKYRITVAEAGNIGSSNCRVASNELAINVRNPLPGTATSNSPVCVNSTLRLLATSGISYQWTGPAGFTSEEANPAFKANNTSAGQYTVIIADPNGCKSSASTIVNTIAAPAVMVSNTQSICLGNAVNLMANGGNIYAWRPVNSLSGAATNNPIAKPVSTTRYKVTVTDNNNCTDTSGVLVVVNTKPVITAGKDKVIINGQTVRLDGSISSTGNVNYSWLASPSLNDTHLLNPVVNPVINSYYVLTAASVIGCGISTDTVLVKVYNGFYIPNAFTPNGDGLNDNWHIEALQAFPDAVVSVYNRYGNKIFESKTGNSDWDGTYKNIAQPSGAYPYFIDLKNNRPLMKGIVTIVR